MFMLTFVCEAVSGRNRFVVHFDSVTAFKVFCAELELGEGLIHLLGYVWYLIDYESRP